jgi:hypothetical protein
MEVFVWGQNLNHVANPRKESSASASNLDLKIVSPPEPAGLELLMKSGLNMMVVSKGLKIPLPHHPLEALRLVL